MPNKIFIEYNGNNRKEIIRLRKLWKPKCSKCGSVMELLLTTEVEDIGHTPSSIYKCVKCVNYYYIEISQDKRKWISWTYGTNPRIWKAKELNKIRENFYKKMFDFII